MKMCLNCAGAVALLVAFGTGCASASLLFSTYPTQYQAEQAAQDALLYGSVFFIAVLFVISVVLYNMRQNRVEKEEKEEKRHREQLYMQQQAIMAASMASQNRKPVMSQATDTDSLLLERAANLWKAGDKAGAMRILEAMPDNPKARQILEKVRGNI